MNRFAIWKTLLFLPLFAVLLVACPTDKITGIDATASPASLSSGGSSSLSATVNGVGTFNSNVNWSIVSGGGGLSSNTGSNVTYTAPSVIVQTTVEVKATSAGDANFSKTLTFIVSPVVATAKPVISSFTASPTSLPVGGGNTTLAWNVTGSTSLSIDQGVGVVTGQSSKSVPVLSAKTFTLTATNATGSSTATVNVTVAVVTDKTPPFITSISPEDGATGITASTPIVVTFSEPMDQPATQTAFESLSLPTSSVGFSWDTAGTTLTVKPNAPLEYAKGTTLSTPRKTYVFTFTAAAKDKAGNSLVPVTSGFTTLLEMTATLTSQSDIQGSVGLRKNGSFASSIALLVGDNEEDTAYRSFLTFDLTSLPSALSASDISSATLKLYKNSVLGDPYLNLVVPCDGVNQCDEYASVSLDHVDYSLGLEGTDFSTPTLANLGVMDSLYIAVQTYAQANVLNAVLDDLAKRASRENRSQYRLSFPVLTDNGKKADYVAFSISPSTSPALVVEYKTP
jgi:Bacterial Ig-like domain